MLLLVSVPNAAEALRALEGGADLIDAKEPASGPLGPVSPEELGAIHAAIAGRRPVTAALGDAEDEENVRRRAGLFAAAGTAFLKLGFLGISDPARAASLLSAAVAGAGGRRSPTVLVAAAYADAPPDTPGPDELMDAAAATGAGGLLIDTADKLGPGLRELAGSRAASWVLRAHALGLSVTLAGRLKAEDLEWARETGADIAGVRGAACTGGRTGQIDTDRVRALRLGLAPRARSG